MLVQCVRVEDYGGRLYLEPNRSIGRCEFCDEKVFYNKLNLKEVRSKGIVPHLICMPCYSGGNHLRQGYRSY